MKKLITILLLSLTAGLFAQVHTIKVGTGGAALPTAPNSIKKYLNGYNQFVSFNTDSITEGSTNLYYTDTRARAAISLTTTGTSGAATYNNTTGVFNIPAYAAGVGTVTNVSALTLTTSGTDLTSSVAGGTTTPVITLNIPSSSASNRGVLTSADWSTFNGKESALTFGYGLTRSVNTITADTSASGLSGKYLRLSDALPYVLSAPATGDLLKYDPTGGGRLINFTPSYLTSVSGTTNRITSTGGTTPVLDISATFEALLGKVANPLSQFAATTSAQLAAVISDEVGTDKLVFNTSPTLITPTLGAALATSINGNIFTTGSSTYTGASAMTYIMPDTSGTIALMPKRISTVASDTTTLTVQKDVTGLTLYARANKKYKVTVLLKTQCDNTGGLLFALAGPASSAITFGQAIGSSTAVTQTNTIQINTMGTLTAGGSSAFQRVNNATGSTLITAFITTGATAGAIRVQWAVVTLAQTGTILTGSTMELVEEL